MAESQPQANQTVPRQDIVAEFPQEIATYAQEFGSLPTDLEFEPGYYCRWQGRTYIHTRATLPLHAIDDGVGFGLWVEIEPSEFERYLAAQQNDEEYKAFKTEGLLANSWPGFIDVYGLPVTVRTIRVDEKVYITDVHLDRMRDVLFEVALTAQQADAAMREQILNLVQAWMSEASGEVNEEAMSGVESAGEEFEPEVMAEPVAAPELTELAGEQLGEEIASEQVASAPEPSGEQPMGEQVVFEQPLQVASPDQPLDQTSQVTQPPQQS